MVPMSIFILVLSGMNEIGEKISKNNDEFEKMRILGILGHFCPVFGLLRHRYKCLMVLLNIFFLFLSGMSDNLKKMQNLVILGYF